MEKNRLPFRYISPSSEAADFKQSWKRSWKNCPNFNLIYVNPLKEKVPSVCGAEGRVGKRKSVKGGGGSRERKQHLAPLKWRGALWADAMG